MTLAQARDIAIVILAIQGIVAAFVPLVALYYAIIGLRVLRVKLLVYLPKGRVVFGLAARRAKGAGQVLTEPFIRVETQKAALRGLVRAVYKARRPAT